MLKSYKMEKLIEKLNASIISMEAELKIKSKKIKPISPIYMVKIIICYYIK
jgi:hypothetical protein